MDAQAARRLWHVSRRSWGVLGSELPPAGGVMCKKFAEVPRRQRFRSGGKEYAEEKFFFGCATRPFGKYDGLHSLS